MCAICRNPMSPNTHTVYVYKGRAYNIMREVLSKNPSTRQWYKAVEYRRADIKDGEIFIRESQDFYDKFEKVELEIQSVNIR